jgi:hypothetical protein
MFQCIQNNYDSGIVNYDQRERNVLLQNDTDFAMNQVGII